jgi:hypothetical protein
MDEMNGRFFNHKPARRAQALGGLVLMAALAFAACESPTDGEDETYTVTAAANISNGRIIAAPDKAAPGTEITLVLIPNVYYSLAAAPEVTLADGTVVALTQKAETEPYTFAMPAANATVSAGFVLNAAHNDIPLYSAVDLAKIGADPAYPMNGVYKLEADFAVTDWTPIGEFPGKPFTGILHGNNHTITINSFSAEGLAKQAVGLFGYTAFAEMENLNIVANFGNSVVLTYEPILGKIARAAYGSVVGLSFNMIAKNITARGAMDITFASPVELSVGGIIGTMHSGEIENCAVDMEIGAETSAEDTYIGGIVGEAYNFNSSYYGLGSGVLITGCSFTGAIQSKSAIWSFAGGIIGNTGYLNVTIQQCTVEDVSIEAESTGTTDAPVNAGGIVGRTEANVAAPGQINTRNTIKDCTVGEGSIKATGAGGGTIFAGGIAGYAHGAGSISNCVSAVDVAALFNGPSSSNTVDIVAGGIVGTNTVFNTVTMEITNCFASGAIQAQNTGNITGSNRIIAGGIVGLNDGAISSCYAAGSVEGLLTGTVQPVYNRYDLINVGGTVGRLNSTGTVRDCYYMGDEVKAAGNFATAGGIAGVAAARASIANCYALGRVSVQGSGGVMPQNLYSEYNIGKAYSAGGIVGHLQAVSSNVPKTENCVALNEAISAEGTVSGLLFAGRIVGNDQGQGSSATATSPGTPSIPNNNQANSAMTITKIITGGATTGPATVTDAADDPENTLEGKGVSNPPDPAVYTALGWDFSTVWKMGATGYPVLAWQN